MDGCFLVQLLTLQVFRWGQCRKTCWSDKHQKHSLLEDRNWILSEYGLQRNQMAIFKGVVSVTAQALNGRTTSRTSFGSGRLSVT